MILFTKELLEKIPTIGSTTEQVDPVCWVKLFYPDFNWTWYVIEYDPKDKIAYGLVKGFEEELGDFSISELEATHGTMGMSIERDRYFEPTCLSKIRSE